MFNNSRKTPEVNGFHISKDGDDGTAIVFDGLNPIQSADNPRKTFSPSNLGVKSIVGAGHYQISNSIEPGAYEGDGKVVIEGDGNNSIWGGLGNNTNQHLNFFDVLFRDFAGIHPNSMRSQISFNNCILINIGQTLSAAPNGNVSFDGCLVYSQDNEIELRCRAHGSGLVGNEPRVIKNSTFYNTRLVHTLASFGSSNTFSNNAMINEGGICYQTNGGDGLAQVLNCGFRGQISISGVIYSGFSDSQLLADQPDFVSNQGNFEITQNLDDCFNNRSFEDFSLKITSQLIKEDRTVGVTVFMFSKYIDIDSELSSPNLIAHPVNNGTGFRFREVKSGENSVTLTTGAILADEINGDITIIDIADIVSELNFDTDLDSDEPKNQNVPSVENHLSGSAGAKPKRLTFEVRTSRNPPETEPDNDNEWDNSFNGVPIGEWVKHEANNEKLVVDSNSLGKGEVNYNSSDSGREFVCVWIQFRVTLRRDFDL